MWSQHLHKFDTFQRFFEKTKVEAALAAGIYHREKVRIEAVKDHMREIKIEPR